MHSNKKVTMDFNVHAGLLYQIEQLTNKLTIIAASTPLLTIQRPNLYGTGYGFNVETTTYTLSNMDKAKPELTEVLHGMVQDITTHQIGIIVLTDKINQQQTQSTELSANITKATHKLIQLNAQIEKRKSKLFSCLSWVLGISLLVIAVSLIQYI